LALQNRQPKGRKFSWGWTGLLALLLVPTWLGITVFLHPGSAVGWVVDHVPLAEETRLGNLMLTQIRASSSVIEQGPIVNAIQTIGSRLTQGSAYPYRWLVVDHNDANAFAAPGGIVVVYTGLLRELESVDELAGVLAHEVAHIELHHSLQAAVKNLGVHGLISLALGDYSSEIIGQLAQELVLLKFSNEAESEADTEAIERLHRAKLPMGGIIRYFERVGGEDPEHPSSALLQNHPVSVERLHTLKQTVSTIPLYVPNSPVLDWEQLRGRLAPAAAR
jgi:predicted Zn-dependent protease